MQDRSIVSFEELINLCKDKRVLVLDTFLWSPSIETSLEVVDLLYSRGINVDHEVFWLSSKVEDRYSVARRIYRYFSFKIPYLLGRKVWYQGLQGAIKSIYIQLEAVLCRKNNLPEIAGFDEGEAILSSAFTVFQSTNIKHRQYKRFEKFLSVGIRRAAFWAEKLIGNKKPDIVVIFNGRLGTTRIIRHILCEKNIDFLVHERGASKNQFSLWWNSIPHDPLAVIKSFNNFLSLNKGNDFELQAIGEEFFRNRRNGINVGWKSFMYEYKSNLLMDLVKDFDGRPIVVYMTSTDDEFKALSSDLPPRGEFKNQTDAISAVKKICEGLGYGFIVRLHPNLSSRSQADRLSFPFGKYVIEPNTKISSYALIKTAQFVFTHNSQIALEAAALGIPSAFTGRSRFEEFSFLASCFNSSEVSEFLQKRKVNRSQLVKEANYAGAYFSTFGLKFSKYKPTSFNVGKYKGVNLNFPLSFLAKE